MFFCSIQSSCTHPTSSSGCLCFYVELMTDSSHQNAHLACPLELSNQELINAGMKTMDETDQAIERSNQVTLQNYDSIAPAPLFLTILKCRLYIKQLKWAPKLLLP